jgi:hypothetical protein
MSLIPIGLKLHGTLEWYGSAAGLWANSAVIEASMKSEREGINLDAKPSGTGCVDCLANGGWWLHLRRCAECDHIGCCDTSPSQHASKHNATTSHPIINSFEPGEDWFYDYRTRATFEGPQLRSPRSHPAKQPVPGPAGRVPSGWKSLLHQ